MPVKPMPFFAFRDKEDNMQEEALQNDEVFFLDLSLRLKVEGIKHLPEDGGRLPVCFGGNEICAVLPNGGLMVKKDAAENAAAGALLRRVGDIAAFFRTRGESLAFAAKRRSNAAIRSFRALPQGPPGNGASGVCSDVATGSCSATTSTITIPLLTVSILFPIRQGEYNSTIKLQCSWYKIYT